MLVIVASRVKYSLGSRSECTDAARNTISSAVPAAPRRTMAASDISAIAASVMKPARENVTITAATLSTRAAPAMARSHGRPLIDEQRAGDRHQQVQHQRQVVGIAGQTRSADVSGDPLHGATGVRDEHAGAVVVERGHGERE